MTPAVAVAERPVAALVVAPEVYERGDFALRARDGALVQVLHTQRRGASAYYTCQTQDGAVTVLWHDQTRVCPK